MKLSIAIADADAPESACVVWRGFEESIKKAGELGYHGVELALKTADDISTSQLNRWLERNNLEVSCISTGQVFATSGLYFTHRDIEIRRRAVDVFTGLIQLASDFGGMVNVGRARGFVAEDQSREDAEALFVDTTRRICEVAARLDVTIILEPINRYEINFGNTLDEVAALVGKVGFPNLGLMPDVFHMNIDEAKIGDSLVEHGPLIRYIHLADSNRLAPGQGHLDFEEVFWALKRIRFDGWASIEILPKPDPDTAAREASEFILPRIRAYNQKNC